MTGRGVIFDLVAAQSPSYRGRGIARYSTELVRAIVNTHPELVSAVVLHPELPIPDGLEDLREWLTLEPDWDSAQVLHMSSVMEPEVPVRTFWPREASAHRLLTAVTLYDLIPDLFPGWYLEDPGLRRRWRCCREVVRAAGTVFTLSESSRQDTISLLGVPEQRVHVIGSGTAPAFRRPESRSAALKAAKKGVRGLRKGFIIYNGAFNPRKNVDRLIEGYASLPRNLTDEHQLVIACEVSRLTRNHYLVMARDLGIEGRLLIPGFVPEAALVALYQSADLAVFPSLYEGYGLPVIESMACGTPNIAGDNSSLREILPREARFQAADPGAIAEAIERALTDHVFRQRLLALTDQEPPSWSSVAERAVAVLESMLQHAERSRPGWRRRPRLALVAPPLALATALAAMADCDGFAAPIPLAAARAPGSRSKAGTGPTTTVGNAPAAGTGQARGGPGEEPLAWTALARLDPWRGGYDAVVGWAGGLDAPVMKTMEALAAEWPGRGMAVVPGGKGTGDRAALSKLKDLGLTVVHAHVDEGWEATAHAVVEAARGATG
jgi:glycosyltransferase involved in cell wall biosynthesis